MRQADLVVLCLPDDAARQAVSLADSLGARRAQDRRCQHRAPRGRRLGVRLCRDGPRARPRPSRRPSASPIRAATPTGAIALLRPLVDADLLPADFPITVNAVSGYSGGGRSMIEAYESGEAPEFELYGLGLEHKHVPEMQTLRAAARGGRSSCRRSAISGRACWSACRCTWTTLPGKPTARDLEAALSRHYAGAKLVKVVPAGDASAKGGRLDALALNDTDMLELRVFANDKHGHAVLVARLDNLGKGASGAAVQNIGLMLGVQT